MKGKRSKKFDSYRPGGFEPRILIQVNPRQISCRILGYLMEEREPLIKN